MQPKNAIRKTARKNRCTSEDVRNEIRKAIEEGMKSDDPEAVKFWSSFNGTPSPEEVISAICGKLTSS